MRIFDKDYVGVDAGCTPDANQRLVLDEKWDINSHQWLLVITSYSIHYTKLYDLTLQKNVISSLKTGTIAIYEGYRGASVSKEGRPVGEFYVYEVEGVITSYSIHYTKLYDEKHGKRRKIHKAENGRSQRVARGGQGQENR